MALPTVSRETSNAAIAGRIPSANMPGSIGQSNSPKVFGPTVGGGSQPVVGTGGSEWQESAGGGGSFTPTGSIGSGSSFVGRSTTSQRANARQSQYFSARDASRGSYALGGGSSARQSKTDALMAKLAFQEAQYKQKYLDRMLGINEKYLQSGVSPDFMREIEAKALELAGNPSKMLGESAFTGYWDSMSNQLAKQFSRFGSPGDPGFMEILNRTMQETGMDWLGNQQKYIAQLLGMGGPTQQAALGGITNMFRESFDNLPSGMALGAIGQYGQSSQGNLNKANNITGNFSLQDAMKIFNGNGLG